MKRGKVTTATIRKMKHEGRRIAMVTAYDATFARLVDEAGVDVILVGDSLGMVIQGRADTLAVTVDHVVYHTAAVCRGRQRALVVADMPFLSYQVSEEEAVRNAGRMLAEGGAEAVKLEGGRSVAPLVRRLTQAGIPVMGHIGLTPQHLHQIGGYRVQGRTEEAARRLLDDAVALEEAGAFSIVLELVPGEVADTITQTLRIPTIGIGAGPHCDGQVLVCYDYLGLNDGFQPKFLKRWADLAATVREATASFVDEVRAGTFPGPEHTFAMEPEPRPQSPREGNGKPAGQPVEGALYGAQPTPSR